MYDFTKRNNEFDHDIPRLRLFANPVTDYQYIIIYVECLVLNFFSSHFAKMVSTVCEKELYRFLWTKNVDSRGCGNNHKIYIIRRSSSSRELCNFFTDYRGRV